MLSPISSASQVQAASQVATPRQATLPPRPQLNAPSPLIDTVQLSAAAQLRQELTETPQQTAVEAARGNQQAKNLLAREAAQKAAGT